MAEEDFNDKNKEAGSDKDYGLPRVKIFPIKPAEGVPGKPLVSSEAKGTGPESTPEGWKAPASETKDPGKTAINPPIKDKKNNISWIIWLLLLLFLGIGIWFYLNRNMDQLAEQEPPVKDVIEKPLPPEPEPPLDEVPEAPVEKITLTEISSRADLPRYFVVVGSFIDPDLAKDYSQELNQKGFNTFLVHPYGEIPYYRLSIGHFGSFGLAVKEMDRVKADFDKNLWVLKY